MIAAAGVAVVVSAGLLAAGCGSSAKRVADTTPVPVASTSTARPTTTWSRTQAEAEVRAAYQNFRVKLRELGRHPSPNSPIIDELYVPGAFMNSVRTTQRNLLRRGLRTYPSRHTRWRVLAVRFPNRTTAELQDCLVDGEVVKHGNTVVNDAVNTYEYEIDFVRTSHDWLVLEAGQTEFLKGVTGCGAQF